MKHINNRLDQDYQVNEETYLSGMVNGNVTVSEGNILYLHGMVNGNLVIEKKAIVELHGMVNGNVKNLGGTINKYGMINGIIQES